MAKYDIVLLDIDNTILDFNQSEEAAFCLTLDQYNMQDYHYLLAKYKEINHRLWKEFELGQIAKEDLVIERFKRLFNDINLDIDYYHFNKDFLLNLGSFPFYMEGAVRLLDELKGKVTLVGATNGVSFAQRRRIKTSKLEDYLFHVVVSEEAGFSKPDIGIFEYTFKKCGFKEEDKKRTIILGDSLTSDILGGINFKIATCYYNPNSIMNNTNIKPNYEINDLFSFLKIVFEE